MLCINEFFFSVLASLRRQRWHHIISVHFTDSWICSFSLYWFWPSLFDFEILLLVFTRINIFLSFCILSCCTWLCLDNRLQLRTNFTYSSCIKSCLSLSLIGYLIMLCQSLRSLWLFTKCTFLKQVCTWPYFNLFRYYVFFNFFFGIHCWK